MVDPSAPPEVVELARQRAAARVERDFGVADELKARIEAAGWRVVDHGRDFELAPARRPDLEEAGRIHYGSVEAVPSRLAEPPSTPATVIVIAADGRSPDACLEALSTSVPPATQSVVVAAHGTPRAAPATEEVRTVAPFGAGDALQAGLRRATGSIVIVLDPERVPAGDIVTPLADALADPSVAIVAADGVLSADLHRYHPAANGDVTTVASGCYAFRRQDALAEGPVDGRLRLPGSVATWLGLLLRDAGPDAEPRRARIVQLPLAAAPAEDELPSDHARLARRDRYRIAARFRHRRWLATDAPPEGRLIGDGADEHDEGDGDEQPGHAREP